MDKLIISPTVFTPKVILDHEEYFLEIAGELRPQDVREFYGPILAWMNDFGDLVSSGKRKDPIIFNFNFDYFNSSSAKCILRYKVLGPSAFEGIKCVDKVVLCKKRYRYA